MTRTRLSLYALAASISTALAAPVSADPAIGIGFSLSFGGGQPQLGAGLRVFSDDDEDEFVGTIGLDYVFTTQSVRPTIGAAYLMDDSYIGLDLGYNSTLGTVDFGASAGITDTDDDSGGSDGNGQTENGNGELLTQPPGDLG